MSWRHPDESSFKHRTAYTIEHSLDGEWIPLITLYGFTMEEAQERLKGYVIRYGAARLRIRREQ